MQLLVVDSGQKNYMYYARETRDEHIQNWTRELVVNQYEDSIVTFMSAFTGGKELKKEEAEELKKLLF